MNKIVIREEDWVSKNTNGFDRGLRDEKINCVARGMRGKVTMLGKVEKSKKFQKFVSVEISFVVKLDFKITYNIKRRRKSI